MIQITQNFCDSSGKDDVTNEKDPVLEKDVETERSFNTLIALGFSLEEIRELLLHRPRVLEGINRRVYELKTAFGLNMLQIRVLFLEKPKVMFMPLERLEKWGKKLRIIARNEASSSGCIVDLDTILSFATFRNYVDENEVLRIARFIGGETIGNNDLFPYADYDIYLAAREIILKNFQGFEEFRTYDPSGIDERTRNVLTHMYGNDFVVVPRPKEMGNILKRMEQEKKPRRISYEINRYIG